jgi:predicted amidohydrolase
MQMGAVLTSSSFSPLLLSGQGRHHPTQDHPTSADQTLFQDHVPSVKGDLDSKSQEDEEAVKIAGGSVIIDPLGNVLAGPLRGSEGYAHRQFPDSLLIDMSRSVLTAELDLDTIIRGKLDLDVVGHYARRDIFSLSVRS